MYRGDLVVHNGATWQAKCDTAQTPRGSDYVCVARAGVDGVDGKSIIMRGGFDTRDPYSAMDIVAYEGQTFVATCDNPACVPGDNDGWQLLAARGVKGERGAEGPRGHKGDRGSTAEPVTIHSWQVDRERYRASPLMSNGTVGPMLELRPLFEQYQLETSE